MMDGRLEEISGGRKPRSSTEQLAAVTSAMSTLIESRDLPSAFQIILRCAMNLTRSGYGFIGVVARRPELFLMAEETAVPDSPREGRPADRTEGTGSDAGLRKISLSEELIRRVLAGGAPVCFNELPPDFPEEGLFTGCRRLRRFLGIPILNGNEVVGMIGLADREAAYAPSDPATLTILLRAAGIFSERFLQEQQRAALEADRVRSQEILRAAEEEFRTLVENSPDVIMKLDRDGTIRFINYTLPQYTVESVVGTKAMDYLLPDDAEKYRTALDRLFRSGIPQSLEVEAAGSTKWLIRLVPLMEDGGVRHSMVIATNITESRRQAGQIQSILEGTCAEVGGDFFRSLVRHLAAALETRWAFISEIIDPHRVRLRACRAGDDYGEPFEYDIRDTPCAGTIQNGLAYFESGLREAFPKDRWLIENGVESYLAIPVYDLEGKPIGHMGVMNDIPMRNRESAESILRIFAIRAGAELNRMLAEETLKARVRQQAAVADLGQRALKGEGLSPLMDEAVRLVSETLDVEFCKILELLPDHRSLLLRAGVGWKKGLVGRATVGSDVRSQAGFTLKSDEPVMVADLGQEIRFTAPPLLMDHGVVSGISVVIPGHAVPFGVLGAHSARRRVFSKEDAHFLRSVANVVAGAIERKRSERAMMELESRWRSVSGQSPEN